MALAAAAIAGVLTAAPARADDGWAEAGLGAGSALCSLLYGPAKILYAAGGTIVSGLAYVFSAGDVSVAQPILEASLRGDYVITPSHLTGDRRVVFVGRSPEDEPEVASGIEEESTDDAF
jgi:hypothetical protein